MLETKKFFIKTHGCQMNEYDSEKLSDTLKCNLNMSQTNNLEEADTVSYTHQTLTTICCV